MFSVEMIQTLAFFPQQLGTGLKGKGVHSLLVIIFDHRRAPSKFLNLFTNTIAFKKEYSPPSLKRHFCGIYKYFSLSFVSSCVIDSAGVLWNKFYLGN